MISIPGPSTAAKDVSALPGLNRRTSFRHRSYCAPMRRAHHFKSRQFVNPPWRFAVWDHSHAPSHAVPCTLLRPRSSILRQCWRTILPRNHRKSTLNAFEQGTERYIWEAVFWKTGPIVALTGRLPTRKDGCIWARGQSTNRNLERIRNGQCRMVLI